MISIALRLTPIFLLFSAFLLLLLATLSAPIIPSISLFTLHAPAIVLESNGIGTLTARIQYGVWGWCLIPDGTPAPAFGSPGPFVAPPIECSQRGLQLALDSNPQNLSWGLTGNITISTEAQYGQAISDGVSKAIVLYPILCGLTFAFLLLSIASAIGRSRLLSLLTLLGTILCAILTIALFIADCVAIGKSMRELGAITPSSGWWVSYGNAPWMTLGAVLALLLAIAIVVREMRVPASNVDDGDKYEVRLLPL